MEVERGDFGESVWPHQNVAPCWLCIVVWCTWNSSHCDGHFQAWKSCNVGKMWSWTIEWLDSSFSFYLFKLTLKTKQVIILFNHPVNLELFVNHRFSICFFSTVSMCKNGCKLALHSHFLTLCAGTGFRYSNHSQVLTLTNYKVPNTLFDRSLCIKQDNEHDGS